MECYRRPVAEGRPADAYCVECDAPMTGDEAALNYKLTDRKTTHILGPACLGKKLELSPNTLQEMIILFRKQGCRMFSPWVEK